MVRTETLGSAEGTYLSCGEEVTASEARIARLDSDKSGLGSVRWIEGAVVAVTNAERERWEESNGRQSR